MLVLPAPFSHVSFFRLPSKTLTSPGFGLDEATRDYSPINPNTVIS